MGKYIKQFLDKLFCLHKWDNVSEMNVFEYENSKMPYQTKRTLICERCGRIKKINL